ncbi:MAG: NAD(P)-dependent oxidoreductase [Bdellovibrionota bacterium]
MQKDSQISHGSHQEKVVITGGAGLVGQNLIIALKEQGYSRITVLDKSVENVRVIQDLHDDVTVDVVDLAEKGQWEKYFTDCSVVVMLHAQIGALTKEPFIRNNVVATQNVLDAIMHPQACYIVHVSSSVVHSKACDFYTESKKKQEQLIVESKIDSVVLRPTLMFGWFDRKHLGWLSRFMHRFPIFPIPGNGKFMRQPLYVRDFCQIVISCMQRRIKAQNFNITGLENIDYIDLVKLVKKKSGGHTWIVCIPYIVFAWLLQVWALFDKNPPFTKQQLEALVTKDAFEVINWPDIFHVSSTPIADAMEETFQHPIYAKVEMEF